MTKRLGLCLLALLLAWPASSAVLTVCAEDISCVFAGTVTAETGFDAGYARAAYGAASNAAGLTPANTVRTNPFTPSSSFWFSAQYYEGSLSNQANYPWLVFYDAGTARLGLRATGVAQQVMLTTRTAANTLVNLVIATGSICANGDRCKLDVKVVYAVAGSVEVYSNGLLILSYSGDITTDGATTLDQVGVANHSSGGPFTYWSELIVANEDTRSYRLFSSVPQAAGTPQEWAGALAGNINELTINDANFNSTVTANQRSNWTLQALPAGTQAIVNVSTCARMSRGTGGPQKFRHSLESGGNQYDNGADITPNTSFGDNCYNWGPTSPATAGAWTPAEFATMETGVLSKP